MYSEEFRREAVELVRASGRSAAEVARDLGISGQVLRNWMRQAEVDVGRGEGLSRAEREELGRLRREVKLLVEERDILKKAAAFFVKESETR
jgi:transposase